MYILASNLLASRNHQASRRLDGQTNMHVHGVLSSRPTRQRVQRSRKCIAISSNKKRVDDDAVKRLVNCNVQLRRRAPPYLALSTYRRGSSPAKVPTLRQ